MNSESSRFLKSRGEENLITNSGTQEENLEILQEAGQIITQEYPAVLPQCSSWKREWGIFDRINKMNRTHSRGNGLGRFASASPDALVLRTVTQATTRPPPLVVAESKPVRASRAGASESMEIQKNHRSPNG